MRPRRDQLAGTLLPGLAGFLLLLNIAACNVEKARGDKLRVVATTTLIADSVEAIGGGRIELSVLLPVGADPHNIEPTPGDLAAVAEADLLFINGLGLERSLGPLLESAGGEAKLVDLSEGIEVRYMASAETGNHMRENDRGDPDPHVWMDPNNVIIWARRIGDALGESDSVNASYYSRRAREQAERLRELDGWIRERVAEVPEARRRLVTDHLVLGYFADRYRFEQVGAVLPGFTALAEVSARDLAALERRILNRGGRAIFVAAGGSSDLARQVAADTGCRLVELYTGSLSGPGGPAADYVSLIRYNVKAIVKALR